MCVFVCAMKRLYRIGYVDYIELGEWNDEECATLRFSDEGCAWEMWSKENCWFVISCRGVG